MCGTPESAVATLPGGAEPPVTAGDACPVGGSGRGGKLEGVVVACVLALEADGADDVSGSAMFVAPGGGGASGAPEAPIVRDEWESLRPGVGLAADDWGDRTLLAYAYGA